MTEPVERAFVHDGESWVATVTSGDGYARTGGVDGNQCTVRFHRELDPGTVFTWQPYMVGDPAGITDEELLDWLERAMRR